LKSKRLNRFLKLKIKPGLAREDFDIKKFEYDDSRILGDDQKRPFK